jgi:hypothetical protein
MIPNIYEKQPKHNPLHFEMAYLAHFPLDWNVFYRFECAKWRTTKKFEVPKTTNHGQKNYNDPSLSV